MAFSPDNSWLVTGHRYPGQICLRDPISGTKIGNPIEATSPFCVVFSPDSRLLASGTFEGSVQLWDVSSRELTWEHFGDAAAVICSILFTPEGQQLICGAKDGAVFVLDLPSRTRIGATSRRFTGEIWRLALSLDGTKLFAATDTLQIWTKGSHNTWEFREEIYPPSETLWREQKRASGPILASLRESPTGWLTSAEGHKLLWIPEHLRRMWSPYQTTQLRLGREGPAVTLDMHDYLVWLSGVTGTQYEVDEEWSHTPTVQFPGRGWGQPARRATI